LIFQWLAGRSPVFEGNHCGSGFFKDFNGLPGCRRILGNHYM
jgi:hypothetical protein